MTFKFFKNATCKGASPPCPQLQEQKCMRYLYCLNLQKKIAANAALPVPKPVLDYVDQVDKPDCVKNHEEMYEGSYEEGNWTRINAATKPNILTSPLKNEDECRDFKYKHRDDACHFEVQTIPLYILAEHEVGKIIHQGDEWTIVSVFPQRPWLYHIFILSFDIFHLGVYFILSFCFLV